MCQLAWSQRKQVGFVMLNNLPLKIVVKDSVVFPSTGQSPCVDGLPSTGTGSCAIVEGALSSILSSQMNSEQSHGFTCLCKSLAMLSDTESSKVSWACLAFISTSLTAVSTREANFLADCFAFAACISAQHAESRLQRNSTAWWAPLCNKTMDNNQQTN